MNPEDGSTGTVLRRSTRTRTPVNAWRIAETTTEMVLTRKRPLKSQDNGRKKKQKPKKPPPSTRKNPRRASAQQLLEDAEGNLVKVESVNLETIKTAQKTQKSPYGGKKNRHLCTVPGASQRREVYARAEKALQDMETCLLPPYGGRPWIVQVTVTDPLDSKKPVSPYFCFGQLGDLELAAWPHVLLRIPAPPKFPGYYALERGTQRAAANKKAKQQQQQPQTGPGDDEEPAVADDDEVVDAEWEAIYDLQEREVTPLADLALKERWRAPLPTIVTKWISPQRDIFASRKAAWEHALVLCHQEVALRRALDGYDALRERYLPASASAIPLKKVYETGVIRFRRDGLWVIGQEERWKEGRATESEARPAVPRPLSGQQFFLQCNRLQLQRTRQQQRQEQAQMDATQQQQQQSEAEATQPNGGERQKSEVDATQPNGDGQLIPARFTLKDADQELRLAWKALSAEEQAEWKRKSVEHFQSTLHRESVQKIPSTEAPVVVPDGAPMTPSSPGGDCVVDVSRVADSPVAAVTPVAAGGECVVEVSDEDSAPCQKSPKFPPPSGQAGDIEATVTPLMSCHRGGDTIITSGIAMYQTPPRKKVATKKPALWTKWCLNEDQVKLCYDAGMAHYDTVIETVKVRDLHRELQDGFDVLRERGRGRFDMELPVFDTPQFGFLNCVQSAPWMPIVRQLLGKEVVLIHKGMFLSMPGAEMQAYHQDGLHLTNQTQRDCHALNVFVPLVDLTTKLGPTQFCLGSHILGQEDYEPRYCETPLVKAGTPILFDYRLGHKGLANTGESCRPILYCTYAKAAGQSGKEFRDKVNFSKNRYHRIGDLISHKQTSRGERAEKRQGRRETFVLHESGYA